MGENQLRDQRFSNMILQQMAGIEQDILDGIR
jgi:hypothetical protein